MFSIKKREFLFICLSVIWMVVIFFFSARNADESTDDSYKVAIAVGHVVVPEFEKQSKEKQMEFAARIDHPIRKCAHATEYAVLGMLFVGVVYSKKKSVKKFILKPLIWCAVYASTDEFHQLFVEGRSGQPLDVLIDSLGALLGILVVISIIQIIRVFFKFNIDKEKNI
ncbi:MAG: VanZ family protein [Lachnospiraceae bacterium]|nr:VanZ family protein [Lachnospiraceae bacterium]